MAKENQTNETKPSNVEVGDEKVKEITFTFSEYDIAITAKNREEAEEKLPEILNKK